MVVLFKIVKHTHTHTHIALPTISLETVTVPKSLVAVQLYVPGSSAMILTVEVIMSASIDCGTPSIAQVMRTEVPVETATSHSRVEPVQAKVPTGTVPNDGIDPGLPAVIPGGATNMRKRPSFANTKLANNPTHF